MKKKFVLNKNEDFQRLIKNQVFVTNKTFTIYYKKNDIGNSRFGISVGKKHGNAVVRNKVKRQVRMMIDTVFTFSKPYDYVIMIRPNYLLQDYAFNLKELEKLVLKLNNEVK